MAQILEMLEMGRVSPAAAQKLVGGLPFARPSLWGRLLGPCFARYISDRTRTSRQKLPPPRPRWLLYGGTAPSQYGAQESPAQLAPPRISASLQTRKALGGCEAFVFSGLRKAKGAPALKTQIPLRD